jgi:hypothetical protein
MCSLHDDAREAGVVPRVHSALYVAGAERAPRSRNTWQRQLRFLSNCTSPLPHRSHSPYYSSAHVIQTRFIWRNASHPTCLLVPKAQARATPADTVAKHRPTSGFNTTATRESCAIIWRRQSEECGRGPAAWYDNRCDFGDTNVPAYTYRRRDT